MFGELWWQRSRVTGDDDPWGSEHTWPFVCSSFKNFWLKGESISWHTVEENHSMMGVEGEWTARWCLVIQKVLGNTEGMCLSGGYWEGFLVKGERGLFSGHQWRDGDGGSWVRGVVGWEMGERMSREIHSSKQGVPCSDVWSIFFSCLSLVLYSPIYGMIND